VRSDLDVRTVVVVDIYKNKISRMLSECFLMDAHRKVDSSGSLAASGGEIHHVMTGKRGL